jgi:voltage-gated potassium channel
MKHLKWETFILILSFYVIIELAIEIIYQFDQQTIDIINSVDLVICLIFLGDFFYFLWKSENKKSYLKKHWIDFIASIPFMTFLRVFRLARFIRIIRLLRGIKGLNQLVKIIGTNKLQNILVSYIAILVLVMSYSALAFYSFEKGINNMVNSFFDAFWWAFMTTTSVGCNDIIAKTTEGRIISMALAVLGMGLFSLVTAELAAVLLKITKKTNDN